MCSFVVHSLCDYNQKVQKQLLLKPILISGWESTWVLTNEVGIIPVSFQGKKHAQKVRLYFQVHGEQDEGQKAGKQKKTDYINFQVMSVRSTIENVKLLIVRLVTEPAFGFRWMKME